MQPVVHLREAVCVLGRFPALAGATLSVDPGEVVLLQGPNGAGKSTLLRLCAGLIELTGGEATVLGNDLRTARRAVRPRVGLLGHGVGLYEDLTVADNLRFWARAVGRGIGEVDGALAQVEMDGRLAGVEVSRLSAGQRRRTAIGVLLVRHAELWLLDEPHAGLDVAGRNLVDRLVQAAAQAGATVLIASHDLDRAAALAGRTVTVIGGMVVEGHDAAPSTQPEVASAR